MDQLTTKKEKKYLKPFTRVSIFRLFPIWFGSVQPSTNYIFLDIMTYSSSEFLLKLFNDLNIFDSNFI